MRFRFHLLIASLVATLPAFAGSRPTPEPVRIPVAAKGELQTALDRYGSVRLDAGSDYRSDRTSVLRLSSGQRIYGGWNTRVPRIEIAGGVSDVVVESVRADAMIGPDIVFTGGAENADVRIVGGQGGPGTWIRVKLQPNSRVRRLSLIAYGGLEVSQSTQGYVRDSTFVGMLGYWPGPQIVWNGNRAEPSGGNAFLGLSAITPGEGGTWREAGDLWLVNWDCESWNGRGTGARHCFSVEGSDRVVSVGPSGGTAYPRLGGALVRYQDVGSLVSFFERPGGGSLDAADLVLKGVQQRLRIHPGTGVRVRDEGTAQSTRLDWLGFSAAPVTRTQGPGAADPAKVTAAMLDQRLPAGAAKPVLRTFARPAVPAADLPTTGMTGEQIQAQIDAQGVVVLPAGTYVLKRPLKIGSGHRPEGLIGRADAPVVLVAAGDFPLIEGRGYAGPASRRPSEGLQNWVLSGLTLVGGSHGIRWSGEAGNLGPEGIVTWSTFEDLRFVGQRVAGVEAMGIYGLDANLWRHVDFYDMPVAFRGDGHGGASGMTYADKQVFVDDQYRNVSDAVWFWTTDRPSGGEVWVDNYYADVGAVTRTRSGNNLLWFNSVMQDVRGRVALETVDSGSTFSAFIDQFDCLWSGQGPLVVSDVQSGGIGTLFVNTEFAQRGGQLVGAGGRAGLATASGLLLWGSRITGSAHPGPVGAGVLIDSRMPPYEGGVVLIEAGRPTQMVPRRPATGVLP